VICHKFSLGLLKIDLDGFFVACPVGRHYVNLLLGGGSISLQPLYNSSIDYIVRNSEKMHTVLQIILFILTYPIISAICHDKKWLY